MMALAELDTLFAAEQEIGLKLLTILEEEKSLLESRHFEDIPTLLDNKSELIEQLDKAFLTRSRWCKANDLNLESGETDLNLPESTLKSLQNCLELYKNVSYNNELNGALIANSRKRARLQLEVMRGQTSSERVYDATGATAATKHQRSINQA